MAEETQDKPETPEQKAEEKVVAEEKPQAAEQADTGAPAPAEFSLDTEIKPVKQGRIKGSKNVPFGIVHIKATFNNTMVSITDMTGAVISWSSAGRSGFKGSRKSTAFAATMVAQEAARVAIGHGMHEVEVRVQGPGAGRESAIRAVQSAGLTVNSIKDVTSIPHNGCRPRKRRRV